MPKYPDVRLLIGGEWKDTPTKGEVLNPADETVIGSFPHADSSHLDDAIAAAVSGLKVWRDYSPGKRSEIMLRAVHLARERVETIAATITLEQERRWASRDWRLPALALFLSGRLRKVAGYTVALFLPSRTCITTFCGSRSA
jgi:acyl-CoA reductase-like NAD-dependent aldehyde dehydrogenase